MFIAYYVFVSLLGESGGAAGLQRSSSLSLSLSLSLLVMNNLFDLSKILIGRCTKTT